MWMDYLQHATAFVQLVGAFIINVIMDGMLRAIGIHSSLSAQTRPALAAIKGLTVGVPVLVRSLGIFLVFKYLISDEDTRTIREITIQQPVGFENAAGHQHIKPEQAKEK